MADTSPADSHLQPSARLLVVDDSETNRDMLSRRLQRKGYEVEVAEEGYQALNLMAHQSFDLVLLDIMMPGLDGLEVLKIVRQTTSPTELPIIMTTAKDQSKDVVEALDLGANDYIAKPIDFPVLLARVKTQVGFKQATGELNRAYRRIKDDLEMAAGIQQSLLPSAMPELSDVRFAWKYLPCEELAGDILNVFQLDENHVGLYLLDVSGHGVQAALLSSTLSRVLSLDGSVVLDRTGGGKAPRVVPPVEVAETLNQQFPMDLSTCQFFTILYGVLELDTKRFRYVCAGHPDPIRLTERGGVLEEGPAGSPIGFVEAPDYQERCIELGTGERLYIYSDGIPEARNPEDDMYDMDRFIHVLEEGRKESLVGSLACLLRSLQGWMGDTVQDDISIVAFEIT